MEKERLVSVIITTYGRTDFLEKALESVCSQTYKNIEIILVDDNAQKKEIRDRVTEIAGNYPVSKFILNEKNLGGSLSRNEGIKAAEGDFISFLDDDDFYVPERIEKYLEACKSQGSEKTGIIYSFVDEVTPDGTLLKQYRIQAGEKPLFTHMLGCIAATSQWMVPKNVFERVGMFEESPCKQDSIMLLKILGAGYEPLCVGEVLSYYTNHNEGRISGVSEKNIKGLLNLRDWSRRYYGQLTKKEQRKVEAHFSAQLITLYLLTNQRQPAKKELLQLGRNDFFSVSMAKSLAKYIIGKKYPVLAKKQSSKQ